MRIAVLVKQIPAFAELKLGPNGRLWRDGVEREMNPYCRRAVAQAVELAAAVGDGQVTAFTLGPPVADEVLREAIAWGEQNAVSTTGVLVSDPEFSGSIMEIDLSKVEPCLSGPKRPHDRVNLSEMKKDWN